MSELPDWLPELLLFQDYGGYWQRYENEVYARFYTDFIESKPTFQGMPVHITKNLIKNKERTFWHLIQQGPIEKQRTPDLRRCERIKWIRAIIEHCDDSAVKMWTKKVRRNRRCLIWLEQAGYLVILEKRTNSWILWTAYCTTRKHTKRKLRKEYEQSIK